MQTLLYFARIIRSFTVDFELFLLPKSRKYRHGTGRRCLLFYRREIGTHGHAHNLLNHYYNRNNRSGRIRPQRETSHVFDVSSPERRFRPRISVTRRPGAGGVRRCSPFLRPAAQSNPCLGGRHRGSPGRGSVGQCRA